MSNNLTLDFENFEKRPLSDYTEQAYLDYSMYVILDRALPHIGDGLKPVQRRIIYAMSELGLGATAKYKKSARTIGDVIGKFHPHGDSACYEAMVLMAQNFTYRYPLVDGQGNWGSIDDPKSFAAMRYTESRLTAYAATLLTEIPHGTVDWVANFDGTLYEPKLLPARLPNVLLNGTTGIAVGMATDIPPHNLNEVVTACIRLLEAPKSTVDELCEHIQGPDFPTRAEIITPKAEIVQIYKTGNGTIKMRATWEKEDGNIIITALPYQSTAGKVLEQIAAQMNAKKLSMIDDLRDESDHENPVRLVLVPRSNRIDIDTLMSHLFATTDLERNYRVNLNMIGINGRPQVKDIRSILKEWLHYRITTMRRRLQHRLDKVEEQIHVLEGLMIAYLNIDEVIAIIRKADKPKPALVERFSLSDTQAEAILELKLRKLAKLEEITIKTKLDELAEERETLKKTLASEQRLKTLIKKELLADVAAFGDQRQSQLVQREESQAIDEKALIPTEPVTVILSQKGWVRSAKGHDIDATSLNYKAGDAFLQSAKGRSNQSATLMDSTGRCYSLPIHGLPSARSLGEPASSKLTPPDGSYFVGLLLGADDQYGLLGSSAGYGLVAKMQSLVTKNKNGKAVLNLPPNAQVLMPRMIHNIQSDNLAVVSNTGRLLLFPILELPVLSKGKGNKLMQIPPAKFNSGEEYIVDFCTIPEGRSLIIHSGQRSMTLKPKDFQHYIGERARRGNLLPRGYRTVSKLSINT